MIRNFYYGTVTDFLTDKTTQYPSLFLQDQIGIIDLDGKLVSYPFKMFLLDLEHVDFETQDNTLDVQSDMMQIATDLLAQFDFPSYEDWEISGASGFALVREGQDDIVAGTVVDFTVSVPYDKDTCSVPDSGTPGITEGIYWGYFENDPYNNIDTELFVFSKQIPVSALSYALDFTYASNGNYIAVKEAISDPVKGNWMNTPFNYGTIPDQVFRDAVEISGYRYYISRSPIIIQNTNTQITFNV